MKTITLLLLEGIINARESVDGGGARVVIKSHAPTRNWKEQVLSSPNGFPKASMFSSTKIIIYLELQIFQIY